MAQRTGRPRQTPIDAKEKICSYCKMPKPISAFVKQRHDPKNPDNPRWIQNICSACKSKRWRKNHGSHYRAYRKKYRLEHLEADTRSKRKEAVKRAERKLEKKIILLKHIGQEYCGCCGIDEPRVLSFHHRDPSQKSFGMADGFAHNYPLEKLKPEADKCDVLCLNCHTVFHSLI